ncbi:GTP cyclohydrolase 1 type 2/Nif3 [Truncatella angustata]|uniref:GTP cyclohydrolase 1 type 2/Nif3 n=1 Tax=Truncatella angustata TaxID=152316 RepID=A0A9P8UT44_9PEZI|nr:GTP cyclohydrolase 1 type 2/Nif3 [Truncatella angustata]KAH6658002.1 GTP cyclohydrolase 1 type 2/Nif3 [Truncatella angustata]
MTTEAPKPSFTTAVVEAIRALYPQELADGAWDNTGLLLDQAQDARLTAQTDNIVLLTNDLSAPVVDEALRVKANVIISYHPCIFRGLKSLTNSDPMQASLLRLIAAGVAVYCPHTAMDAAHGGINDWICDIVVNGQSEVRSTVLQPISRSLPEGHDGAGYGRSVVLDTPLPLSTLLKNLSAGIGGQRYISIALPPGKTDLQEVISKVAVCAGSGSSVLKGCDAQLLVTGEMSHHDALHHTQLGQIVATVFHSNSERHYLTQRLKPKLEEQLKQSGLESYSVLVSKKDRDPFETIDVTQL